MQLDIILPLVIYLIFVFALSIYAYAKRKKVNQFTDYFIGNRTMGGFLLAMTLAATYISASSFIGGPGAAYKYGLGWVLLSMIQVPTVLLSLGILGKKFAILARKYNAITLSDMLYSHYKSKMIVWFASIALITAFIGAMTVQFVGGARLLQSSVGIPYDIGLLIFGIGTVIYTAFGGFRASILNDAFQGLVMIIGAILLLVAIIYAGGGITNIMDRLNQIDPALLTPQGPDNFMDFPFMASFWVLVCFGVVGLPHTAVRCMAYKDSKAVHQGIIIGTTVVTIIMLTMHLSGALGRAIISDLTIPDQIVPTLIIKVLPPLAAGIFLAAPLSAIMSTINAQLLQVSSVIIKDLFLTMRPNTKFSDKMLTRISIIITFIFGGLLIVAAWNPPEMIIWLNLLAFGGLEAVFLWPLVLGLYWKKANSTGALCSMISGAISYTLLAVYNIKIYAFHPIVPSLLIGLVIFIIANHLGQIGKNYALDSTQN
ncbi:sodium/pantothenate symporter [Gilliamella apis]|uniref:Sodium/pantothenate symporter n=1 Tax=Gilliamella apis TaxID=1970738 RepID=A0A242NSJ2_9GAMM|nr:sodium/pantothenate symporter [Gilliamella apis]OTQ36370.1 sodium/panthothenate symporter [Gilliamella apis]OTQ37716.1 sodium/panthothenate symporter [Gilliamella apis]OTQ41935.1 sodium/panthothenate symporter [Gilliamella apis]OTQ42061.1 sodium/panthothenate symporter [Gilliamella apis]OTQ45669.1 sodium/panthothenate symporter [Gilliamella apis]